VREIGKVQGDTPKHEEEKEEKERGESGGNRNNAKLEE
jgi:hypothetical protein